MTALRGTTKQNEYITLYNKLHEIIMEKAKKYFQDIADGKVKDNYTSQATAQQYLRNNFIPFMSCIHVIKEENYFVYSILGKFYEINNFRNSLTHDNKLVEIFEPTDLAISILEDTIDKLTNPMKVREFLQVTNKYGAETIDLKTPIIESFSKIEEFKYTQFPVFDNEKFKGLISDNGIAYWIVNAAIEEKDFQSVELSDVTVSDVLDHEEKNTAYKVIRADSYLHDALKHFSISEEHSTSPILLVTEDGDVSSRNSIMGVLTGYDYLEISNYAL